MNATQTWRTLLADILERGVPVEQDSAGAVFRGRTSYEVLAYTTRWSMANPVVLCPSRKLGFRFAAAEAAWILSGSNRLDEIAPYARNLVGLSDDGTFLAGAYGPRFVDDLPYVCQTLARDGQSRQAVASIWRARPGVSKDVPCTISLQWMIRPRGDGIPALHCIANLRSSDVWLRIPYDVHSFSMMSAYVALHLRDRLGRLALGDLYVIAGSQHLYKIDREAAAACVWSSGPWLDPGAPLVLRDDEAFDLAPIGLDAFARPDDLVKHLWGIAERDRSKLSGGWLAETLP